MFFGRSGFGIAFPIVELGMGVLKTMMISIDQTRLTVVTSKASLTVLRPKINRQAVSSRCRYRRSIFYPPCLIDSRVR